MRFAIYNNTRCEASPEIVGLCPTCSANVIAKCGTRRIWHWAHLGKRNCDPWWESETEWHRAWKKLFPSSWQEFCHKALNGERHIADVKTAQGLVIELQHSAISDGEMAARELFYGQMVWVVDGTRLKSDVPRFNKGAIFSLTSIGEGYFITSRPEECFPTKWLNRRAPVLFDFEAMAAFQKGKPVEGSLLWCLLPGRASGHAVVARLSRRQFVEIAYKRASILPAVEILEVVGEYMERRRLQEFHPPRWRQSQRNWLLWRRKTPRL